MSILLMGVGTHTKIVRLRIFPSGEAVVNIFEPLGERFCPALRFFVSRPYEDIFFERHPERASEAFGDERRLVEPPFAHPCF